MRKKLITFTGGAALLLMHAWSQAATDLPPSAKVDMGRWKKSVLNLLIRNGARNKSLTA